MMRLLHTCPQEHRWTVRCDISPDGLLYPDPMATVCKVCYQMGAAQHDIPIAYRICPECMAHYGILLVITPQGATLPEQFPMLCQSCGQQSGTLDYYGDHSIVSLPLWAYQMRKAQTPFREPSQEDEHAG